MRYIVRTGACRLVTAVNMSKQGSLFEVIAVSLSLSRLGARSHLSAFALPLGVTPSTLLGSLWDNLGTANYRGDCSHTQAHTTIVNIMTMAGR